MRILAVIQGEYGKRIADNVARYAPASWRVEAWVAPARFPIVIDDPQDFLPAEMPPADLILSLGEHPGVAELLPDIARKTGAKAVIAPVDRAEWLPKGLARQVEKWLAELGVASVFPKPFCTLTESSYSLRAHKVEYSNDLIAEFARHFGRPRLRVVVDAAQERVASVIVERDSACGCARFTAERMSGLGVDEAEQEAGMLHHHYPCLASMGIDPDYGDTLMHVSGNILRDEVAAQVKPYLKQVYFTPVGRIEGMQGDTRGQV